MACLGDTLTALLNAQVNREFLEQHLGGGQRNSDGTFTYTSRNGRVWSEEELLAYFWEAVSILQEAATAWERQGKVQKPEGKDIPVRAQQRIEACLNRMTFCLGEPSAQFEGVNEENPFLTACFEFWLFMDPDDPHFLYRCSYVSCGKWFLRQGKQRGRHKFRGEKEEVHFCSPQCKLNAHRYGKDDRKRKRGPYRRKK